MMPFGSYQGAWGNPYPIQGMPYQQPYQQQPVNGITKVRGPQSALQFNMGPNSTSPALFDENGLVFYVVSTDGTGTKSLETFDYSPHVDPQADLDGANFVTRDEFKALVDRIDRMNGAQDGPNAAVPATPASQPAPAAAAPAGYQPTA